uniref:Class II aldolase/adducin N-terminal domain-containing protein n=1 Tax=Romanomermis culicivorax TaxID=13658 RepID=A0A915JYK3_ROMCU
MPVKTETANIANGVVSPRREFDPEDPEYIKDLQRPAVIKEDLNEMERRKRVRQILESKSFREELENLIISERQQGTNADNLRTLEKLSELISPAHQSFPSSAFPSGSYNAPNAVVPIADLRGPEATKYSLQERLFRNKLASLYRLIDLFQWSQGIFNHVTFRLSSKDDHILINPYGLLYHEVTASSLVKIDLEGRVIDNGSTSLGINEAGYVLHTTIHKARPDVRCIIHLHTPVVVAVTAMKCGLLPISQDAIMVGPVSYHDFQGIVNDEKERESLVKDLGSVNKVMVLRNHGFVVCGSSLDEAFLLATRFISACETQAASEAQIRAARAGIENLVVPSEEAQKKMFEAIKEQQSVVATPDEKRKGTGAVKWKSGELEWEAWMRVLDNAGFRTGHIYRQGMYRIKPPAAQSDVEVPPAATAYGLLEETDETDLAQRVAQLKREQERAVWLNSPNVYQKVEFEETGTSEPKKLTKWIQDESSPAHSTLIKISTPHQFSPLALNTREFKDKQKAIKENRRAENITAGPQSRLLEGVSWQEGVKMADADISGTQERVMIGAASRGIIERDYRHNAQIFRQLYQPNPFVSATDEDIQRYMHEVEEKTTKSCPRRSESDTLDRTRDDGRSESPESVSLMQAARDVIRSTPTGQVLETTFEAATDSSVTTKISPAKNYRKFFPPDSFAPAFRHPAGFDDQSRLVTTRCLCLKNKAEICMGNYLLVDNIFFTIPELFAAFVLRQSGLPESYFLTCFQISDPVTSGITSDEKALSEEEGHDVSVDKKEKKKKKFHLFGRKDKKK